MLGSRGSAPHNLEIKFVCGICGHSVIHTVEQMCIGEMLPLRLPPEGWSVVSFFPYDLAYDLTPHHVSRDFNSSFPNGKCPVVICPKHNIIVN